MLARSVPVDVGLRILDIFILQHSLKVGSNYGQHPSMRHADILTLAQTATLCRGVIAESPQLEFNWRQIFETASVDALALEANLQRSRQHNDSIKELLMKQIVFTETGKLSKADFFNSLCLAELDYEAAAGFSSEEYALFRQVHMEQKRAGRSWSECSLVTTMLYNMTVLSIGNQRLKLRRISFATLAAKINCLATKTPTSDE
ncbi:hypothetical protein F443_14480 [Phytophthora nicotianae P1569]|uniref:Uncharacterized protein n=1 Tax=Phytophthora nicotianae P1569 TaxID=1317065 RepID=V9ELA6_PHYNI|nr:hypothetical protein F443_14480 [Phytophthora nicotianae P1569]